MQELVRIKNIAYGIPPLAASNMKVLVFHLKYKLSIIQLNPLNDTELPILNLPWLKLSLEGLSVCA